MVGILTNKKLTKEQKLRDDWSKDMVGRLHAYAIFVSLANQRHVINTFFFFFFGQTIWQTLKEMLTPSVFGRK